MSEIRDIKEENLNLKKKITEQDDRTKKLLTKISKLSSDLKHSHGRKDSGFKNKKEEIEVTDLIQDLKSKISDLSKNNSQLKTKVLFFKSLHEASARKRTPYDHIPPRIKNDRKKKEITKGENIQVQFESHNEDLENLNSNLRIRVIDLERELEEKKNELNSIKAREDEIQKQDDIDRMSLQFELVQVKKQLKNSEKNLEILNLEKENLEITNLENLKNLENSIQELKQERIKNNQLNSEISKYSLHKIKEKELNQEILILKEEISVLKEEQEKLTSLKFHIKDANREEEHQKFEDKIRELEGEISKHIKDKSNLSDKLQKINADFKELMEGKSKVDVDYYNLKLELEETRDKLRFYNQDGQVDLNEINEALALLRLKRDKGLSLEFLEKVDELQNVSFFIEL
jgi:chromosome segregation ATPase